MGNNLKIRIDEVNNNLTIIYKEYKFLFENVLHLDKYGKKFNPTLIYHFKIFYGENNDLMFETLDIFSKLIYLFKEYCEDIVNNPAKLTGNTTSSVHQHGGSFNIKITPIYVKHSFCYDIDFEDCENQTYTLKSLSFSDIRSLKNALEKIINVAISTETKRKKDAIDFAKKNKLFSNNPKTGEREIIMIEEKDAIFEKNPSSKYRFIRKGSYISDVIYYEDDEEKVLSVEKLMTSVSSSLKSKIFLKDFDDKNIYLEISSKETMEIPLDNVYAIVPLSIEEENRINGFSVDEFTYIFDELIVSKSDFLINEFKTFSSNYICLKYGKSIVDFLSLKLIGLDFYKGLSEDEYRERRDLISKDVARQIIEQLNKKYKGTF